MTETPPVLLPDGGALLPDGTLITLDQMRAAVERCMAFLALLDPELEELLS